MNEKTLPSTRFDGFTNAGKLRQASHNVPSVRFKAGDGSAFPDWEEKKLGDLLSYIQPTPFITPDSCILDQGDYPVLTANKSFLLGYTNDSKVIYSNVPAIIFDDFTLESRYIEKPFSVRSSAVKILNVKENNSLFFVFCLLQQCEFTLLGHARHYVRIVQNTSVPVPAIPEQHKIASFLSSVDETLALCLRKLDLLTQAKKALIQQIFSRKLRFTADDGSDFPEWEEKKLGDIAEKIDRKATSESTADIRMISQGEGFILQSRKYSRQNAGKSLSKYLLLKKNEFAYNHGASKAKPFGVTYRLVESSEARVPYVYHAFSITQGDLGFWSYALNTESIERQLQKIITSGVRMDGLLNISFEAYMSVSIPFPCVAEQQKIAACLSSADALIDQTRAELEQWQEVKKSLLQQLFV